MFEWKWQQKISEEQFKDKYCLHGEKSVDEVLSLVAEEISSAEKSAKLKREYKDKFYQEMISGRFIPAGRILANARPESKLKNYCNCFAIEIKDDMHGIYNSLKEDALIGKAGGGVGIDVSPLRPKNDELSKGGVASGPLSFLEVFDASAQIIQTGGSRRAAHIALLDVSHPDIEEFITYKHGDKNKKLKQFNISVKVTDKFMRYVEEDRDWKLRFNGKIYKTVKARKLYDLITKHCFIHNEPGIFFVDTVNRFNNGHYLYDIHQTNPCFSGQEELLTVDGYKTFAELEGTEPYIINSAGNVVKSKVWKSGTKHTIKLTLSNRDEIICTSDHEWATPDSGNFQAKDLKGKRLWPFLKSHDHDDLFVKLGFIQGDGSLSRMNSLIHKGIEINIGEKDKEVAELFDHKDWFEEEYSKEKRRKFYTGEYNQTLKDLEFDTKKLPERELPKKYGGLSYSEKASFWRGVFSANGCVIKGYRVVLKTTCRKFAEQIKTALEYEYDISTYITTNKSKKVKFSNGIYLCKESYDVNIGNINGLRLFYEYIGFVQEYKTNDLKDLIMKKAPKVIKIEDYEYIDVYDFTEPENHWGVVNGFLAHNCGEQPLPPYGVCNLGSINLIKFVEKPFEEDCSFNLSAFANTIDLAVRFLDNVIDKCEYPLEKIKERALNERRVGLGITGLADALTMLRIKYGDSTSEKMCKDIFEVLRDSSYCTSARLAEEKGVFPSYKKKDILDSKFIKTLPPYVVEEISKKGLRNITLNTIAPTGTTSLTLGQNCSSGIEPIFALEYERNIRTKKYDEFKKEKIFDYAWSEYLKKQGKEKPEYPPEHFVTTIDIKPEEQIRIQMVCQKYIDASISKTVNLPPKTTFEEYKKLFMLAYKQGLKGFTTFNPEGSMRGILEYGGEKRPDQIIRAHAPKRPKIIPCDIYEISVNKERHIVLCGLYNGSLYEVFVTNDPKHNIDPIRHKKGFIEKERKNKYNLIVENDEMKTIIKDIGKIFNDLYCSSSRLVSIALRHGVPLQFICQQLEKDTNLVGFDRSVMRVLKKYIKNGEKVLLSSQICQNEVCRSLNLIYQNGCVRCADCGWEKCAL